MGRGVHEIGLNQTITYWAPTGDDGFGGQTFATPTSLNGRFQKKRELFLGPDGQEEMASGTFYLDADVSLGGYLYEGTSAATDPTTVEEAWMIRDFQKSPRLGNETSYMRKALV